MKNEIVSTYIWNPSTNEEFEVLVSLESIIRKPSGYRMDRIGLLLFNRERRLRGLSEYKLNPQTGTYDEN